MSIQNTLEVRVVTTDKAANELLAMHPKWQLLCVGLSGFVLGRMPIDQGCDERARRRAAEARLNAATPAQTPIQHV